MSVLQILNLYFNKENSVIDDRFYDPDDVVINEEAGIFNLRDKFNINKLDKKGINILGKDGKPIPDKIADGAGHFKNCPYYVIEVKTSDVDKAKKQLKSTVQHIYDSGVGVRKVAIILDEKRWSKSPNVNYKIEDDLLKRRGRHISEFIHIFHDGHKISREINCYLVDFEKFGG